MPHAPGSLISVGIGATDSKRYVAYLGSVDRCRSLAIELATGAANQDHRKDDDANGAGDADFGADQRPELEKVEDGNPADEHQ